VQHIAFFAKIRYFIIDFTAIVSRCLFSSKSNIPYITMNANTGASVQKYQFVAAITADPKKEGYSTPSMSFMKTKAVSFPGGEKFQPLSECEMDPRADGCQPGDEDYVKYEY
jgi:hypothetical protein